MGNDNPHILPYNLFCKQEQNRLALGHQLNLRRQAMTTREDFIKKYASADVDGRMEIILKNYGRFMQMV